jgi:ABC-type nitrate/sulfonate/bicarbonate transport system substrate-binding protein
LKPINQTLVAVMLSTNPGQDKKLEGKVMSTVRSFRRSDHLVMIRRLLRELAILLALYGSATPTTANANPFLAKAGEASTTVQVATCAVSGGFIHLYTAMDNGLFDKYGIKIDHRFISGSA